MNHSSITGQYANFTWSHIFNSTISHFPGVQSESRTLLHINPEVHIDQHDFCPYEIKSCIALRFFFMWHHFVLTFFCTLFSYFALSQHGYQTRSELSAPNDGVLLLLTHNNVSFECTKSSYSKILEKSQLRNCSVHVKSSLSPLNKHAISSFTQFFTDL